MSTTLQQDILNNTRLPNSWAEANAKNNFPGKREGDHKIAQEIYEKMFFHPQSQYIEMSGSIYSRLSNKEMKPRIEKSPWFTIYQDSLQFPINPGALDRLERMQQSGIYSEQLHPVRSLLEHFQSIILHAEQVQSRVSASPSFYENLIDQKTKIELQKEAYQKRVDMGIAPKLGIVSKISNALNNFFVSGRFQDSDYDQIIQKHGQGFQEETNFYEYVSREIQHDRDILNIAQASTQMMHKAASHLQSFDHPDAQQLSSYITDLVKKLPDYSTTVDEINSISKKNFDQHVQKTDEHANFMRFGRSDVPPLSIKNIIQHRQTQEQEQNQDIKFKR